MSPCEKDSIAFFGQLGQAFSRCMDTILSSQPKCHFPMLHRLAVAIETEGRDGSIYVSELGQTFYNSPQAVSRGLRILEQDGLVERCTDPNDRRKTMVRLTPAGQEAHDACEAAVLKYGSAVAARMGHDRLHRMQEDFAVLLSAMEAESAAWEQNTIHEEQE